MSTSENLYTKWKQNLLTEMEKKRDILVLQAPRGRGEPLFEIASPDDKLYQRILSAFEQIALRNVENLIYILGEKYNIYIEYGDKAGCIYADLIIEDQGVRKMIDIKSETDVLRFRAGRRGIKQANTALLRQKETPVLYIILQKDSDNSRRQIERAEYKLNEEADGAEFKILLFEDFLLEYFGQEELNEFRKAMLTYKEEMHKAIGYQITEIMNPHNLQLMKDSLEEDLLEFDYDWIRRMRFSAIREQNPNYNDIYDSSFNEIRKQFIEEGGYRLLLGDGDFAVSFLTSEWLYKKYFTDSAVDNTFIVAGYLKSIEQLLWNIIYIIGQGRNIKKANTRNHEQASIEEDNIELIDQTLGSLQYFITNFDNEDLFSPVFGNGVRFVMRYLRTQLSDWRENYRNGYFHKHNLKERDTVDRIRDETLFLYFLILGTLRLNDETKRMLGLS